MYTSNEMILSNYLWFFVYFEKGNLKKKYTAIGITLHLLFSLMLNTSNTCI